MNGITREIRTKGRQSGFTIIELVVVILLLGILTATALPRFLEVTDEAHGAVVDATEAGLLTGMQLFRSQWIAESGSAGSALADWDSMQANSAGYPIGLDADTDDALSDNTECLEIFDYLLQVGHPTVAEDTAESTSAAIDQTNIDNVSADFLAQFTAANTCTYAYLGQFSGTSAIADNDIPVIELNVSTGVVGRGTAL
jgi:MSHA pilin protein MshB